MGNYQRLLGYEQSRYEVVGFAENLSGTGTPVRDLEPLAARCAYATAGEFIFSKLNDDMELAGGDLLMYCMGNDSWATLSFAVADSVRLQPITDVI
jgi:hypothetical protein